MTTTLIDDHRADIAALCRFFRVRRLEVFGSAARDDFDPRTSDVDLLYEFEDVPGRNRYRDRFDLAEALTQVLGRSVDLVPVNGLKNPYLLAAIDADRRIIHAA